MDNHIPEDYVEIDPNFQPLSRARSNTWPLRPVGASPDPQNSPGCDEIAHADHTLKDITVNAKGQKAASRRNAWGNLSYADLITSAIQSSPEQRLTLSQIYDWMVHNVAFFRDKGESNSSAGWKNSIRHNLSLHNRFMRMPNEGGAGKSSWWVINPEAKPGKAQRSRRSNSMETKTMEKKRHKARKRVEAIRAMEASPTRLSDDRYLLSPIDLGPFRDRTSSNASTLSGRLSPIPAFDKDLDDDINSWGSNNNIAGGYMTNHEVMPDNLVDSLMDSMRLVDGNIGLAATPEESMMTDNVDQGYMSAGNYGYSDISTGSLSYPDTQNISPPHMSEMPSPKDPYKHLGMYQQPCVLTDSTIMEDMILPPGMGQGLTVQQQGSPCGSPQNVSYLKTTGSYHNTPQTCSQQGAQTLSPQGPQTLSPHGAQTLSPQGAQTLSPQGSQTLSPQGTQLSPTTGVLRGTQLSPNSSLSPTVSSPQLSPQQHLSPHEVRKLILNSSSYPLLHQHLQQIPDQDAANSILLKALTTRTNAHLSQPQIKKLKHLSHCNLESDRDRHIYTIPPPAYNQQLQHNSRSVLTSSTNPMMSQHPSMTNNPSQTLRGNGDTLFEQFVLSNNANSGPPDTPTMNLNDIMVDNLPGADCDIQGLIDYEISLGGDLDFNFDSYVH